MKTREAHIFWTKTKLRLRHQKTAVSKVTAVLLVAALAVALVGAVFLVEHTGVAQEPDVFVGVDVGFGNETYVYAVADAVKGFANLIIVGSLNVTKDPAALLRVCNYLYQNGFYFIVYVGFGDGSALPPQGPEPDFFTTNQARWGDKLLGTYMFDEPGGKQLDASGLAKPAPEANNNSDAAIHFLFDVNSFLTLYKNVYYNLPAMRLYTSDYALYWYDYLANYDVVFCEFIENNSRQIAVGLTRGAAETQGKQWGTIITWSCNPGSCLENGAQIYNDFVYAYDNGAKYMVVFDSPGNVSEPTTTLGILTQDQLDGIQKFWDYTKTHSQPSQNPASTAYVLPKDMAYGFRSKNDSIWGLWPSNATSMQVWVDVNALIANGTKLDIVYVTRTDDIPTMFTYKTLIFWNGTTITK
jgi:hypothetical protein